MAKFVQAAVTVVGVAAFLAVACNAAPQPGGTSTTVTMGTVTATATESATATVSAPVSAAQPAAIKVPDVSGMNHQDAQDAMQAAGLYNLREVDSSGKKRPMIIDRNWCQTGQDPKPGTVVSAGTVVTLYADKC
ncbi:PASTA domain-containing protein [Amycolatopsis circi]|uniref:PASTA domain-containing protein n=1 Tax=Amycolatopsis circi TaxID=871959 RepID=UPI000E25B916|nr:PASTA domain-containing protein [Amycolatopsis circi]